jgi:hypothetical protein
MKIISTAIHESRGLQQPQENQVSNKIEQVIIYPCNIRKRSQPIADHFYVSLSFAFFPLNF